jgi:glucosamine kinase
MEAVCLFEAGGTKTTLLIAQGNAVQQIALPGFNPNRYSPDFEKALEKLHLPADARVFFYGSGLSTDTNKEIVRSILAKKMPAEPEINHDQLGAARAVWGDKEGLIGIMGTGAFAAWYDGQKLVDRKGGHGYLIDDIGGGFEMGKVVLSAWLNHDLPAEADQAIAAFVKTDKAQFTTQFYKNPDLSMVAGISKIILPYSHNDEVHKLLVDYFGTYFTRHIRPVLKQHGTGALGLVGGIAVAFERVIRLTASQAGIAEIILVENPAEKLLEYHRQKKG